MAYFANGTEGCAYEETYCMKCAHHGSDDGPGCPVWDLHLLYNYDQCGDTEQAKELRAILGTLIPESKDGLYPEKCALFIEGKPEPLPVGYGMTPEQVRGFWTAEMLKGGPKR